MSLLIQGISVVFITITYFVIISNYTISNFKDPILGIVVAMVSSMIILITLLHAIFFELADKDMLKQ